MEVLTKEVLYKKSPQELTSFLYEGIIENLESSLEFINQKMYWDANVSLQKASDILHRLGVGLKYESGPIAQQLDVLYNFVADLIISANIKKDPAMINSAINIIEPICGAWNEILKNKRISVPAGNAKKMSIYENSIMRTEL